MERRHMQGGCFDSQNYLHLTNGKWTGAGHDYSKGTKGGIAIFRPSESPQKGGVEKLYRLEHSTQSGAFAFKFSGIGEEPEGITYWDLDNNQNVPKIQGQLHAIMLDNVGVNKDDFFFKHYRRNQTDHHFQVTVNCGDNLGVAGSAEIGITLYGSGKSTPHDTMKATYNYFEKNWQNTRIIVGNKIGELQQVELSILKTSKASKLYIESVDVTGVEAMHTYHCPGSLWIERSTNPLTRFFLKAIPYASNLGSVVLDTKEPRPGDWIYVNCKPGSGIRDIPRNKVKDQWQRSPDGKSGWVTVPGWSQNPKRSLGIYTASQADVGFYLRTLITVEGYLGTLETEPVKVLRPTLDAWRCSADRHIKLSPENPRPGDTMTATLSSLFDGMKIHYMWRWAGDTSDYYQTRSTGKTYTVTKDDLGGRIDLDITADGYDGCIISAAVQIVSK